MRATAPRVFVLLVVLACFWLVMSGLFKPLLLMLGAASCAFVAWIALRKSLIEDESIVTHIRWGRWCSYNVWLGGQIIKSTVDVTRCILDPKLPISPTVEHVPAELSDLGKVIYANSITLTPGTVSINLTDDEIVVHSLTRQGMENLKRGEMYRRVRNLERRG